MRPATYALSDEAQEAVNRLEVARREFLRASDAVYNMGLDVEFYSRPGGIVTGFIDAHTLCRSVPRPDIHVSVKVPVYEIGPRPVKLPEGEPT